MVNASLENFKRLSIGKDDNTWAQPPESLTQAVGDSFYVVVTHLQSPNEIIVQKVENASKGDSLSNSKPRRFRTCRHACECFVIWLLETNFFFRSNSRVADEVEGSLLSGFTTSELQTSPWHCLLCPVLRYESDLRMNSLTWAWVLLSSKKSQTIGLAVLT